MNIASWPGSMHESRIPENSQTAKKIIMACTVLHNIGIFHDRDPPKIGETDEPLANARGSFYVRNSTIER